MRVRQSFSIRLESVALPSGLIPLRPILDISWNIAIKRSIIKALPQALRELAEPVERALSQLRAVVEHPFHIIKNRFRHKKLRYRGLTKNTAQLHTLFALANLVIVKKALLVQSKT